jgi:hypothetical protein
VLVGAHDRGVYEVQVPVEFAARPPARASAAIYGRTRRPCASGRTGSAPFPQGRSAPAGPLRVRPVRRIQSMPFRTWR